MFDSEGAENGEAVHMTQVEVKVKSLRMVSEQVRMLLQKIR